MIVDDDLVWFNHHFLDIRSGFEHQPMGIKLINDVQRKSADALQVKFWFDPFFPANMETNMGYT